MKVGRYNFNPSSEMRHSELHLKFLNGLEAANANELTYLMMTHLKTSVLYWSLTAATLLNAEKILYPSEKVVEVMEYLRQVYKADGGFAGDVGAHDSHLLFTLSALQIMKMLVTDYPSWFNIEHTVTCKTFGVESACLIFSHFCSHFKESKQGWILQR